MNVAVSASTDAVHTPPATLNRRRIVLISAGLAALLALAAYGSDWWLAARFLQSTDDAYVHADWVALSSRVPGHVAQVLVADDQPVKAGDILVRLQERDYRAHLQQGHAAVAQAEAALAAGAADQQVAQARIDQQRAAVVQAQAAVRSALAEHQRSQLDVRRYRDLVSDHAATAQRLERVRATAAQAEAAWRGAEAALRARQAQAAMAQAQAEQAVAAQRQRLAALRSARARQTLAEHDVEDTVLRAPVDGVVGQRRVRAGQYVVPGQPLLAVVPLQQAYVVANYKETQLAAMRPGQPVRIEVDSFPGMSLSGRVASVSPASGNVFALLPSDNATGNFTKIVQRFPVRITLDRLPAGLALRPGMSVLSQVDTRPEGAADAH
ncbi:HlyD family secretion protein [Pseudomonas cremoricolorata]|uniref:Hemolysin D n=1 Tax=Pseudomonas cremoricolorata TaxID=157783 RepID=A0A089WPS6_9PSED|nr:HlyD family secretion protein [Pseudomonas cremoricolorata]AIR91290.1 hemolysin D [Pseudomonas cremoricolorata]